ncbi:MAG TPA: patatin-like phospholipase family protein [Gemmatales bacterium]|nr:patatin-like phospholipase family protein [Gemmatales bacterium]
MLRRWKLKPLSWLAAVVLPLALAGCLLHNRQVHTPTSAGLDTNNLIDPSAQIDSHDALRQLNPRPVVPGTVTSRSTGKRSVLCLSGGGAYGAYTVGVLYGWSCLGTRPCFDVVTGVSTGALIAPYAFLGSSYDQHVRELYTTMDARDIYKLKPVTGVFSESFASNRPLARKLNEQVTPQMMAAVAREHAKGRRLYVGTSEMEGHRFVVWDVGAIASGGRPEDLELIKKILLASSAIPGLFPPTRIPVTVNGEFFTELHVDGSVQQSVFFRPPVDQPGQSPQDVDVYVIVAGKLYAGKDTITPRSVRIALQNLQTFSYAHTRGDLFRIWSVCQMTGRKYYLTALPANYPAPESMTDFDREEMTGMYREGVRQITQGIAWRTTPPGLEPGEDPLVRSSTDLTVVPRSTVVLP